jgi:hypothetical protein
VPLAYSIVSLDVHSTGLELELQVEQRPIDLKGISRQCGMKRLFQRTADLAAFEAQWLTNSTR